MNDGAKHLESEQLEDLKRCIIKHLPDISEADAENVRDDILLAWSIQSELFLLERSRDEKPLKELRKGLEKAAVAFEKLSFQAQRAFIDAYKDKRRAFASPISEMIFALNVASKQFQSDGPKYETEGRAKWKAASIAFMCKRWWEAKSGRSAPKTIRRGTPSHLREKSGLGMGPFGEFLTETLSILGISTNPSTAMNTLNERPEIRLAFRPWDEN